MAHTQAHKTHETFRRHLGLGDDALARGALPVALEAYGAAHTLMPDAYEPLCGLGQAALDLGMADRAARFFQEALIREPGIAAASCGLARALSRLARHGDAIEALKGALALSPATASLWLQLGTIVRETGELHNAAIFYREALRLNPQSAEAMGNLGDLAFDDGKFDEAFALYERALAIAPQNAQLHVNRAAALLARGEVVRGWAEYEWRLELKGRKRFPHLPRWRGEALSGKALLVLAEQGIGDEIAYASYIPDLCARADVTFACAPRLAPLFARSFPEAHVIAMPDEAPAGFDLATDLASLPHLIGPWPALCNVARGFLRADPGRAACWSAWLSSLGPRRKIGLSWRSGKLTGLRALQYPPLELWASFARRTDAEFVCIQYGAEPAEIAAFEAMSGVRLHVPPDLDQKNALDETAAMIAGLDGAVCVANAVAWMAAGLGVPTFKIQLHRSWTAGGADMEPMAPVCRTVRPDDGQGFEAAFDETARYLARLPSRTH